MQQYGSTLSRREENYEWMLSSGCATMKLLLLRVFYMQKSHNNYWIIENILEFSTSKAKTTQLSSFYSNSV